MSAPSKVRHPLTKPPLPKRKRAPAAAPDPERDRLRAAVDVDGHLARVRELLTAYRLERRDQPAIYELLATLEEHEREQRLFLGVVGEFSSGKSTLLNALLRDDLLRTDILQGTTAAATVMSYGGQLAVAVRKLPRHPFVRVFVILWSIVSFPVAVFRRPPKDRESLRTLIHQSSAVEEVARSVAQVNVSHPAECLKNGMVIIDLPGTNAENPRHGGVTADALTHFCDAAVVVVPADTPGSETLWGFLQNHLDPEVLRRCVFVLNKIDLLRKPQDRDKLVANLESRLRRDLNIDNPRIVTSAPERVLEAAGILASPNDPEFASTPAENARWTASFEKAEGLLWSILKQQKLLLQVERLARLLTQVFERVGSVLATRDTEHADRHAALQAGLAQIPDLRRYVADAQKEHCGVYASRVGPVMEECGDALGQVQKVTMRSLAEAVFAASSKKELQEVLEGPVQSIVSKSQKGLRSVLQASIAALEATAEAQHRQFHVAFQIPFRNLATLGGRVRTETSGLDKGAAKSFAAGTKSAPSGLAQEVAQVRKEDLWKKAGGAGAGAVVGTMLLPGVGTLIGGVLGGIFGALFGPSFAEIRQKCWNNLRPPSRAGSRSFSPRPRRTSAAPHRRSRTSWPARSVAMPSSIANSSRG